ncbi:hypothetical protein N9335_00265 [Crocinitomicaceae bacterium]|nr:hypothetical protein [Crocinitomicaceae bacterium]
MKKLFISMLTLALVVSSCGDGDKDTKDAESKKSEDGNGGSGSSDTWGACGCLKYSSEMMAKWDSASSEEDRNKIEEEAEATMNSKCSAFKEMDKAQVYAACEEEIKKADEDQNNESSGQQDQSAGNQNGDICDCLMAAMKANDEEQAMACDPSKSEDEMKAILEECLSGGSKNEERGEGDSYNEDNGDEDYGDEDYGDEDYDIDAAESAYDGGGGNDF